MSEPAKGHGGTGQESGLRPPIAEQAFALLADAPATVRPRPRWTERRSILWLSGVISAVVGGLLVALVLSAFEPDSLEAQLRAYVADQRNAGNLVVVNKRLQLPGPGLWSRVLVLRDRSAKSGRSDRLVVLDEDGSHLREAFSFQPTSRAPTARTRVLALRRAPGSVVRGQVRYALSLEGIADLSGSGNPSVLLALDGGVPFQRYPVVLHHDSVDGYDITPLLTERIEIGPGPRLDKPDARVMLELYQRKLELVEDAAGHTRSFRALGADLFTLIAHQGAVYLGVGFVVARGSIGTQEDTSCEVEAVLSGRDSTCAGVSVSVGNPELVNMKAWRFGRQGVGVTSTYCGGSRTIVRVKASGDAAPLRQNWRRYIAVPRSC